MSLILPPGMTRDLHCRKTSNARPLASRRLNFEPDAEKRHSKLITLNIARNSVGLYNPLDGPTEFAQVARVLRQTVLTPPGKLGYAFSAWTLSRLADFLKGRRGVHDRSRNYAGEGGRGSPRFQNLNSKEHSCEKSLGR